VSTNWDEIVIVDEAAQSDLDGKLTRHEKLLLAAVDGRRSVRQVVAECHLGSFDSLKLLHQFLRSRVLRASVVRA
jgi:hypothetical protein